jgi:response regulator RpfG family c-di-GMP phosphodiesterase
LRKEASVLEDKGLSEQNEQEERTGAVFGTDHSADTRDGSEHEDPIGEEYDDPNPRDAVIAGMTEKRTKDGNAWSNAAAALRAFVMPQDADRRQSKRSDRTVRYSDLTPRKTVDPSTQQGARVAKVMQKMYLLVASVDIGSNSYYIECGGEDLWDENGDRPGLARMNANAAGEAAQDGEDDSTDAHTEEGSRNGGGEPGYESDAENLGAAKAAGAAARGAVLPKRGYYENLMKYLKRHVDDESAMILDRYWSRKALVTAMDEARTEVTNILCVQHDYGPEYIQIRCERIPEAPGYSRRYRGVIYLKYVTNQHDDGRIENGYAPENKAFIEDPDLASLFDGIYELDTAGDRIYPYTKKDGRFVRMQNSYSFSAQLASYVKHGIITEETQRKYMRLLDENFLKKSIKNGQYMMEMPLVTPGAAKPITYSEILVPIGRNRYRVYRNNIDRITQAKAQVQERHEQEQFNEYNKMMLVTMAGLVEFRNNESGAHITHVADLAEIILTDIANRSPQYKLTRSKIDMYRTAAVLHDIGKIAIPDSILNKPEPLTDEEREIMKSHTIKGAAIIDRIHAKGQEEILACCHDVALHHHERYDGTGYPEGLKGDDISIGAQAVALADVFDALISERVYKSSITPSDAYRMIMDGECGSFNPRIIETFKVVFDKMCDQYK